jgi:hypothetical protein
MDRHMQFANTTHKKRTSNMTRIHDKIQTRQVYKAMIWEYKSTVIAFLGLFLNSEPSGQKCAVRLHYGSIIT